jgi:hypothetical protein
MTITGLDPTRGLPSGALLKHIHDRNAHLQGYTLAGVLGYFCFVCGFRPKFLRRAVTKHRHWKLCEECGGPVHRACLEISRGGRGSDWRPCASCALQQAVAALASVAEPVVALPQVLADVLFVLALAPSRVGKEHVDSVRFAALASALASTGASLFGVSNQVESTVTTLMGDIRRKRCWYTENPRGSQDTVASRFGNIGILDHYWCPAEYFARRTTGPNGYGDKWFSEILPLFFAHGGILFLLPNDKDGLVRAMHSKAMHSKAPPTCLDISLLTLTSAEMCHPLYVSTDTITDFDKGELRGVAKSTTMNTYGRNRTNALAVEAYLDPEYPFILVYNTTTFSTAEQACARLSALI